MFLWHIILHWRHLLSGRGRGDDAAKTAAEQDHCVTLLTKTTRLTWGTDGILCSHLCGTRGKYVDKTPPHPPPRVVFTATECATRPERAAVFVVTKETWSVLKLVRVREPSWFKLKCKEILHLIYKLFELLFAETSCANIWSGYQADIFQIILVYLTKHF